MRFARALAGMLLLIIGIPALVAGGALWIIARHADPGDRFHARVEPVRSVGHALVVTDLADLLHRDAPIVRAGTLRLTARTADGPAFLGLAPADEVQRWLGDAPRTTLERVALGRGALPVRVAATGGAEPVARAAGPVGRSLWVREGVGALEWHPTDFDDQSLSLVVMHPDGRADITLDLRAELRVGWLTPARWTLPVAGVSLVALALLLLLRSPRPREVVFVVEPDQVPVLAQRLGVTSLSGLGGSSQPVPIERTLVAVGAPTRYTGGSTSSARCLGTSTSSARCADGSTSSARPATLADLFPRAAAPTPPVLNWPPLPSDRTDAPGRDSSDQ